MCICNDLGLSTPRKVEHYKLCEMILFKTVDLSKYLFKSLEFFLVPYKMSIVLFFDPILLQENFRTLK